MRGESKLKSIRGPKAAGFNVKLSSNAGRRHSGGACFGDSGGPVLEGDVAGALIAFGSNDVCKGSHFAARLDPAPVQTWVLGFLE